jgi:hypothetical protein
MKTKTIGIIMEKPATLADMTPGDHYHRPRLTEQRALP